MCNFLVLNSFSENPTPAFLAKGRRLKEEDFYLYSYSSLSSFLLRTLGWRVIVVFARNMWVNGSCAKNNLEVL